MDPTSLLLQRLRSQIGRTVRYEGSPYLLIDVLAEGPYLVLRARSGPAPIQANQYGEPGRRAERTLTLPLLEHPSGTPHPLLYDLDLGGAAPPS